MEATFLDFSQFKFYIINDFITCNSAVGYEAPMIVGDFPWPQTFRNEKVYWLLGFPPFCSFHLNEQTAYVRVYGSESKTSQSLS